MGRASTVGQPDPAVAPLVIASILRHEGRTGVHTHVRQLRSYLNGRGVATTHVTPFNRSRVATTPVFGLRVPLDRCSGSAGVAWYYRWHEAFLRQALRAQLLNLNECVVYAQDPFAARAALAARSGRHQRVVMAVHFRISEADEWADKGRIKRDGSVYRAIRDVERAVIPRVDGLVYVSRWARDALTSWLPEAETVPFAIIDNFVAPRAERVADPLGDLVTTGGLEVVKNHRFLLHMLAHAQQAGRIYTLDLFGDGPCRTDLARLARTLKVEDQVRFRGFRSDVRDFLPGYRAYVHASYSESSSLAIIEAMAAGLPILAGDIGPISHLCTDGAEARLWPLDDPSRAASMLIELLECEPARLEASRAARERFRRDFHAEAVAPRLHSFLLACAAA